MKKRVLSLLLVVAMLATLVVLPVSAADTDKCPHCDELLTAITWKTWTGAANPASGHYRLESDLQTAHTNMGNGKNLDADIVLDLNGHVWRGVEGDYLIGAGFKAADSSWTSSITLSVFDSVGGGELQATGKQDATGVVMLQNGTEFNLYSGTIRQLYSKDVVPAQGVLYAMNSTVNMSGGKITDGYTTSTAAASAGNVLVRGTTEFTMTGGEITNGYATQYGGGVVVYSDTSCFNMSAGTISGNITEGNGGNIYVSNGSATFSGSAVVENGVAGGKGGNIYFGGTSGTATLNGVTEVDGDIYVNREVILDGTVNIPMGNSNGVLVAEGGTVALGEDFSTNSVIYAGLDLGGDGSGVISAAGAADAVGCFLPVGRTYGFVANDDTTITANCHNGIDASTDTTTKSYCPHCDQLVTWNRFSMKNPNTAGHYLVNGTAKGWAISAGTNGEDIVVDMNGITYNNASGTMFTVNNAVTGAVNISFIDTRGSGKLISGSTTAATHGGIVRSSQSNYATAIELWSGTLTGTSARGGVFGVYLGSVDIKGGIIKDSKATGGNGGAVWTNGTVDITMSGGLISNCSASSQSGALHAMAGLSINGGMIQGCSSSWYGGSITLLANKTYNISNAVIRGGSNSETTYGVGGNICLNKAGCTLNLDNSTVAAGTAAVNGGNIGTYASGSLVVTNSVIYDGTANSDAKNEGNGGNIYFAAGRPITLTNTKVYGGAANGTDGVSNSGCGGNIYVQSASQFDMTDCVVADGTASFNAGNVFIRGNCSMAAANLTNTRIYNGACGDLTTDTHVRSDNVFTGESVVLDDVKIQGCSELNNIGSGLNATNGVTTDEITVTLKNNTVIGDANDPLNGSLYVQTSTGVGKLLVDSSFTGLAVLSPKFYFDEADQSDPYGKVMLNASYNGAFIGKLYLGDHKTAVVEDETTGEITKPCEIWAFGMPEIFQVADGQLQVAGGLVQSNAGNEYFLTAAEAVAAYEAGNVLKVLGAADELTLAGGTYYIDVNGKMPTVSATAATTVYGLDSANAADLTNTDGALTVGDNVTVEKSAISPLDGKQYVTVMDAEDLASFHNIEMDITKVTLRTSSAGVFYKGQWTCDTVLEEYIQANELEYGVVVSLTDMPGADFASENTATATPNLYSVWGGAGFASGAEQTGVAISNIILATGNPDNNRTADQNAAYAQKKIYAKAYLSLGDGKYIVGGEGASLSMMDVLKKIDQALVADSSFTTEGNTAAAELMATFYDHFAAEGLAEAITEYGYTFQAIFQ